MVQLFFDATYPGYTINVELIVMKAYLSQLDSGIKVICEKYESEELLKYEKLEYHEYSYVFDIAEDFLPRIIRLPFVVTIFTLYENSVKQLLKYAQKKEGKLLGVDDIYDNSLTSKYRKYMKHVLCYDFDFSSQFLSKISDLQKIRNYIAHSGGNLDSLREKERKEINRLERKNIGISIGSFEFYVSSGFLYKSFAFISDEIVLLMRYMECKYMINSENIFSEIQSQKHNSL